MSTLLKSPDSDVRKMHNSINNSGGLRQAAWRVRRSLPRDEVRRTLVLKEINRLELSTPSHPSANCDISSLTHSLLSMAKMRCTRKFDKVEKIASGIKKKYKSLRAAHRSLGCLTWKRWHSICKPKKVLHIERRITEKEKQEIVDLFESNEVSVTLPFKRYAKKRFMVVTVCEAYQKYIRMKKELSKANNIKGVRILSISSFYKLRPKHVKPKRCLPLNQCTCGSCANFSLQRSCLIANGVKGITKKSSTAACSFLCPSKNLNEEIKFDLSTYKRECLYMECTTCTPGNYAKKII